MHAAAPEISVFQVFFRLVPQPVPNIFTNESGSKISSCLVAVDHSGRASQQLSHAGMKRRVGLLGGFAHRDVAPGPDDLQRLTVHTSDQTLSIVHPAIGAIAAAEAVLDRLNSVVKEFSDCLLDAGEIVGMNAITPKVRVLQVLCRRV